MNEKKIHTNFLNDPPPVDVPSADDAWANMQQKLVEEDKKRPGIGWTFYPVVIILFLIGNGWLLWQGDFFRSRNNSFSRQEVTSKNMPVMPGTDKEKLNKKTVRIGEQEAGLTNNSSAELTTLLPNRNANAILNKLDRQKKIRQQKAGLRKDRAVATTLLGIAEVPPANIGNYGNNSSLKNSFDSGKTAGNSLDKTMAANDNKQVTKDSTGNTEEVITNDKIVSAGIEWNAQIPFNGTTGYFAGPNGSSQPYRLLFPGLWLNLQAEKNMFTIRLNPFATAVLSDKPYSTKNTINGSDVITETRTLHKVFGTLAALEYNYNISGNWWFGGNMQANFWHSGTATAKGEKMNVDGSTSILYRNKYSFNDSAWADFTEFQLGTGVQWLYKLPKWQAGIRFDYSLVPLIDKEGQKNTTSTQIFIRWQLYNNRKAK